MTQPTTASDGMLNWVVLAGMISALTGMLAGFASITVTFMAGDISAVTAARDYGVFGFVTAIVCTAIAMIAHWQRQSVSSR